MERWRSWHADFLGWDEKLTVCDMDAYARKPGVVGVLEMVADRIVEV